MIEALVRLFESTMRAGIPTAAAAGDIGEYHRVTSNATAVS